MPPAITRPAIVAVAHTLRSLREERGISLRQVARMAKISPSKLSNLENGTNRPEPMLVAYLLGLLGASKATLNRLKEIACRIDDADFFDPTGRDANLLRVGFEQWSTRVFEWSPTLFPERLRSDNYRNAIQRFDLPCTRTTEDDLVPSTHVSLASGPEVHHTFLLGEAATRPDACSPSVLDEQIEEAATVSKLLNISIGHVPASFCPPGLVEPFTLYENHAGAFAVFIRHHHGTAFLTNHISVTFYAKAAKWLQRSLTEAG
ncbi:Scr1 family TA system antitoxin-like transcriptional regulator [Amycolatopsis sp. cmx-4-68]|uniref:Scr1 family TA system antitoxin-like transcriptional regulator n=1 Tax=Amycolatopsis sp. cmx-4-68 TaxID=2790938 RepID=UPI00397CF1EA